MRTFLIASVILGFFACSKAPADKRFNPESSGVVLQYHHVDTDTPPITSITPEGFNAHMAWLEQQDFNVWPLDRLMDSIEKGEATPDKTVAITFDDAYISIYNTAFPVLRKYGFPFTIFVATEYVGTNDAQYLGWDELREMQAHQAIIASHTHSHTHLLRRLDGESQTQWLARMEREIVQAMALIEEHTGSTSNLFAYPYGEYDTAILGLVRRLGLIGFGQHSGAVGMQDAREALPRFPMGGIYSGFDAFKTKIETLPLPIEPVRLEPLLADDFRPRLTL
ncbi:MAG: polysaccharide deacetylase family protein, partial [Pseudomonadales bacterium]